MVDPRLNEVHLWVVRPPVPGHLVPGFEGLLAGEERERYGRFRFDRHRNEYLLTRALVRSVLSQYRDVRPGAWEFSRNPWGKPEIGPRYGLQFNLSNTPGLVVCLVGTGGPVGVDAEPLTRGRDILEVASDVFSETELTALRAIPDDGARESRGLSLWTLKEAYIKARGMGLSLPLREFSFLFTGDNPSALLLGSPMDDAPDQWRFSVSDIAGHRVSVLAAQPGPLEIQVFETHPASLGNPTVTGEPTLGWSPLGSTNESTGRS